MNKRKKKKERKRKKEYIGNYGPLQDYMSGQTLIRGIHAIPKE